MTSAPPRAATEQRHAAHWQELLADAGREPVEERLPWRQRVLLWAARRFGIDRVLPWIIRTEAADRVRYRATPHATAGMAEEEAEHVPGARPCVQRQRRRGARQSRGAAPHERRRVAARGGVRRERRAGVELRAHHASRGARANPG